ncbi:MAG: VOC family protein [Saccharopolyspora sp.]|uniref:VOC family protein n=1 Tax=unclassified Saccharopolyspora TaxID=2646250 RepID=UPI0025CF05E4|nr:VOC family protein [Saccharopolyspora sp.]MBQ6641592.1 VOC family protein [Saccharopolyspora sp.]
METPFRRLHHICIVVRDIERAVRFYESVGIGPWQDYPPLSQYTFDPPDHDGLLNLKYKFVGLGDMQLQMVEPGEGDSPQRRFLEERGEGVFHLGFLVDDVAAATDSAGQLGLPPWLTGRREDSSGFTFFETAESAGVHLEIRQSPRGK